MSGGSPDLRLKKARTESTLSETGAGEHTNIKLCKFKGPVGFQTEGPLILDLGMKESRNAQAQECEGICLNRVGCASVGGGALSQEAFCRGP